MLKPDTHTAKPIKHGNKITEKEEVKHIDFGKKEEHENQIMEGENIFNIKDKDEINVQIFFNSIYKGPECHWYCNEYHLHGNGLYMPRTTRIADTNTSLHQVKQWATQFRDKLPHTTTGKPVRWKRIQEWPVRFLKELKTTHGWNIKLVLHLQPLEHLPASIKENEIDEVLRGGKS